MPYFIDLSNEIFFDMVRVQGLAVGPTILLYHSAVHRLSTSEGDSEDDTLCVEVGTILGDALVQALEEELECRIKDMQLTRQAASNNLQAACRT